jgi:ribosome-associated protein
MPRKKKTVSLSSDPTEKLLSAIVKGILDKKGKEVITLDLRQVGSRVCDYFILCHGDSTTQVSALGGNVENEVRKLTGEKPWHSEGFQNSEWILLDYVNVVVHVFLNEKRTFYNLEKLWGDAAITRHEDELPAIEQTDKGNLKSKTTKKSTKSVVS